MRDELISVYASHKVADVLSDPQYQQLCKKYAGNVQFDGERRRIEEAKGYLESRLEASVTFADQVRGSLKELNKLRRAREQSFYYDLIVKTYKPNWSKVQKEYFEHAWRLISSEHDFFFSFTTRYSPPGGDNPINGRYEYLIKKILGSPQFRKADRSKRNLLAEALYRLLAQRPYHGFLFTLHENDNAVTETKLKEACAKSLVFIQVVQNIMFEEPLGRTNYCFFEHTEAINSMEDENRIIFVVAENCRGDLVPDFSVPRRYDRWHSHVVIKDPPYLEEASNNSSQRICDLKEKFEKKVVRKVQEVLEGILTNVPD